MIMYIFSFRWEDTGTSLFCRGFSEGLPQQPAHWQSRLWKIIPILCCGNWGPPPRLLYQRHMLTTSDLWDTSPKDLQETSGNQVFRGTKSLGFPVPSFR